MSNHSIPIVDLSEFAKGNPEQKQHFVKQLGEAFEQVGFFASDIDFKK